MLCSPFRPSHSAFHTQCSPRLNLLFATAFIAPSSISLKTVAIHLTNLFPSCPRLRKPSSQQCAVVFFLLHGRVQSSCRSSAFSSSMAKLQLSSRCNSCSNDSSNPHSPGLDNWQSNRSINWSLDSYVGGASNNSSHPHSPGLDPWQSNGFIGEGKGSSSGIYNLETDNSKVPQGSGGSSSNSKG